MIYSDNYNPATANNSYSNITILNAKNEKLCEKTKKYYCESLCAGFYY